MSTGAIATVNSVKEHGVVRDEGLFDSITGKRLREHLVTLHHQRHVAHILYL
jgi:hypothetical protein